MSATKSPSLVECLCCGGVAWREYGGGLVQCPQCGYARAAETYSEHTLREIYTSDYFEGHEYRDYRTDRAVIERTLGRRLACVRERVPVGGRLLEVGCAYGFFLHLARSAYPDSVGVDVAETPGRFAREQLGLDVRTGDLGTVAAPDGAFDAACLWDTIEHLPDPADTVRRLAERVRAGGWLMLTTGDLGAMVARFQGPRWRLIHPPSHLHYFTRRSMHAFLRKLGFRVRRITTCAVDRSVEQIVHGLSRFGGSAGVRALASAAHRRLPQRLGRLAVPLDLGDIMFVEAQRVIDD